MSHRLSSHPSGQVHKSLAVRELIDQDEAYNTSTTAWAEFDRCMSRQLAQLERKMRRYFTPAAKRTELGR